MSYITAKQIPLHVVYSTQLNLKLEGRELTVIDRISKLRKK